MGDCGGEFEASGDDQRRTLRIVLAINAMMFVAEIAAGLLADSTGLIADSLDMLADASVYAISLYVVGRASCVRRLAAKGSGLLQMALGTGVVIEATRRFYFGAEPIGWTMIATAAIALLANAICLRLLWKYRRSDVNFRASYIFSANDVIANAGVMISLQPAGDGATVIPPAGSASRSMPLRLTFSPHCIGFRLHRRWTPVRG